MLPLTLLFCQQLVVWPMKQQCSTRGLPPAWPPNGINPIAEKCPGFDADFFPSSISNMVYQGCSLQLWTHSQASDSANGPGHI